MPALVSAIVLNYRSPRDSTACVEALLCQSVGDRLEILLVDNHSDDESIAYLRNRFTGNPRVRIVETPRNLGYGQGNGAGARFARGEYLLIINPDNELEPEGLERLIAALMSDPAIGIVGPRLVHEDGTVRDSFRSFPSPLDVLAKRTALGRLYPSRVRRYLNAGRAPEKPMNADWLVGACLLLKRDLFERLGGFDPRFFLFFEDIDLCRRIRALGKRVVYVPGAAAKDRKRRLSEGGVASLLGSTTGRIHVMSAVRYFRKWGVRSH